MLRNPLHVGEAYFDMEEFELLQSLLELSLIRSGIGIHWLVAGSLLAVHLDCRPPGF